MGGKTGATSFDCHWKMGGMGRGGKFYLLYGPKRPALIERYRRDLYTAWSVAFLQTVCLQWSAARLS